MRAGRVVIVRAIRSVHSAKVAAVVITDRAKPPPDHRARTALNFTTPAFIIGKLGQRICFCCWRVRTGSKHLCLSVRQDGVAVGVVNTDRVCFLFDELVIHDGRCHRYDVFHLRHPTLIYMLSFRNLISNVVLHIISRKCMSARWRK